MKSIESLEKADFEALVGQTVDAGGVALEVESVKDGKADAGLPRKPFSVILTAAEVQGAPAFTGPVLIKHDALGEHELVINRIAGKHDEAVYQIVFN